LPLTAEVLQSLHHELFCVGDFGGQAVRHLDFGCCQLNELLAPESKCLIYSAIN